MPDTGTAGAPRQGIDAVEVAGAILQALLRCPRPARLKDIEIATGIPSAKIHRYLVSMIRCGLVRRHGSSGRYDFGLLAHQVGQVVARDNDVVRRSRRGSPNSASISARSSASRNGSATASPSSTGSNPAPEFSIRLKPGMQLGVTTSATAKLLAAYLPREATEQLVRSELAERQMHRAAEIERVYGEYAEIRARGIANSLGARRSGLNALSVPIFDPRRAGRRRGDRARHGAALRRRHGGPARRPDAGAERRTLGPDGIPARRCCGSQGFLTGVR